MNNLDPMLQREGPVFLDGGLATQLEAMGFDINTKLWSAALLASAPRAVVDAHRAFLDAGADVIISASYQASRLGFGRLGHGADEADGFIRSSVDLARQARDEYLDARSPVNHAPLVAASVGPYGAALHDGSEYTGVYDISDRSLGAFHAERLRVLDEAGADLLAVETIPNFREAQILCELLDDTSTPAWVSFACCDETRLSDGTELWAAAGLFADHANVFAVGINCTPPQFILPLIAEVRSACPDKEIVVYPNSGEIYHVEKNTWSGMACDLNGDFDVSSWYAAGARLIGGCCRIGPDDIREIRSKLSA